MADCGSLRSPAARYAKPISSALFNAPRLFNGITSDSQLLMSPTSILDSIPFSGFKNPFSSESNTPKSTPEPDHRRHWSNLESNKVGLSILDSLANDDSASRSQSKPETRMVLFGSQLKIQVPLHPFTGDFGIKTRAGRPGLPHHSPKEINTVKSPGVFSGCLSQTEMELSEDYTRVISHGPNPKTTHIYHNCIVKSCCGVPRSLSAPRSGSSQLPEDFLSSCYTCRKHLSIGEDIYMYKGEKAFCSSECRHKEMLLDEDSADLEFV
uniref:FLZ-type domain-containing protein n=1 Tax=Kalanchoe fedtschenkoi TaxID=63787 RepID=A0A7N0V7Y2_KALFE